MRQFIFLSVTTAALLGSAHSAHAQLSPEQREQLRKQVEEQLNKKSKPAPQQPGEKLEKLNEQLQKQLNAQMRPVEPRDEPSPKSFRKTSPVVMAAFRDVVAPAHRATVRVLRDGKEAAYGAVVGANGWVVTKASELKGNVTCKLADGREMPARIVGIHEETDIAMLKVEAKDLPAVEWNVSTPQVGEWVATVGLASDPATIGVVSVLPRRVFAPRGILGIGLEQGDGGARIREVMPNSGAAKAGLKIGDVVISVNGKPAKSHEELVAIVARYKPGDTLTLAVRREGKELSVQAVLGNAQQDSRAMMQNTMGGPLSERRSNFPKVLQHDSVLKPTECGGPLVDLDGKVVGINIARAGRVESFAIPADVIVSITADLQSGRLMPAPPITEYERQLTEALASLQKAEESVKEAKGQLDKVVGEAQDALKKVEAVRSSTQKAVQTAQQALEKARAEALKAAQESVKNAAK